MKCSKQIMTKQPSHDELNDPPRFSNAGCLRRAASLAVYSGQRLVSCSLEPTIDIPVFSPSYLPQEPQANTAEATSSRARWGPAREEGGEAHLLAGGQDVVGEPVQRQPRWHIQCEVSCAAEPTSAPGPGKAAAAGTQGSCACPIHPGMRPATAGNTKPMCVCVCVCVCVRGEREGGAPIMMGRNLRIHWLDCWLGSVLGGEMIFWLTNWLTTSSTGRDR